MSATVKTNIKSWFNFWQQVCYIWLCALWQSRMYCMVMAIWKKGL